MEGLIDEIMRDLLTRSRTYDWCVTEFARVTGTVLPNRAYWRLAPELKQGARTRAGTPVHVQLLGSDPESLAENAARLSALGPAGIDLNFGCPAPIVNRHRGGAALLDEPELLHAIARACVMAVGGRVPVTAKMRLGIADTSRCVNISQALAERAEIIAAYRSWAPRNWQRCQESLANFLDAAGAAVSLSAAA